MAAAARGLPRAGDQPSGPVGGDLRGAALPLGILQRDESLALLRHHRPDLAAGDADSEAIAAELGDLPLALHLAGSFLARYRQAITPAAYLAQLRQPTLLAHRSLQGGALTRELSPTQHEQHVARTFALSYDRLDPADPTDASALALLARAAYFAPGQPIPRDLLLATITGQRTPRGCRAGRGCPGAAAGPRPPRAGRGGRGPAAPLTGGVCAGGCPRCGGPDGGGGRAAR